MCGLPAVCGQQVQGRRRKIRGLCQAHADAVFGMQDPPWRRLGSKTQREIVEEWLRAITILAHGSQRQVDEMMAEISIVNDVSVHVLNLVTPLMPGEANDPARGDSDAESVTQPGDHGACLGHSDAAQVVCRCVRPDPD
jgi:hypothetical protein